MPQTVPLAVFAYVCVCGGSLRFFIEQTQLNECGCVGVGVSALATVVSYESFNFNYSLYRETYVPRADT